LFTLNFEGEPARDLF